ncbi:MAG: hypothetical protein ABIQ44_05635 [Chloroflexia bacterium]
MKQKNFAVTTIVLASLLLTLTLTGWITPAQAASPFPVPSGTVGTITRMANNIYTVDTGSGIVAQIRVDVSTVVLKNGFVTASKLRVGDRVVVDPSFRLTSPAPTNSGNEPGVPGSSNSNSSQSAGNSSEGQRPGSTSGTTPTAPNTSDPGSGQNSTPPNSDANAGRLPNSSHAPSPGDSSTVDPGTRNPVITARLIWVPQKDERLTVGKVNSANAVSTGKVTLRAGSDTFTAVLDRKTDLRRQDTVGGTLMSATTANIQLGRTLIIVGTAERNSSVITAKAVLIQPLSQGTH